MPRKKKSEIQELSEFVRDHVATKDDIAEIRGELKGGIKELKGDILRLSEQVTSIEGDIRSMKRAKLEFRVADLEEKVFGKSRA
jgi:hypothetical protein